MEDAEPSFCYLGDTLCGGGGSESAIITRCRCAWGKFKQLLPILTSKNIKPKTRGRLYSVCVRSTLLYASETWAPGPTIQTYSDCSAMTVQCMVRWMCGLKASDDVPFNSLLARLGLADMATALRSRRLRWYGHVMRADSAINTILSLAVPGRRGRGRPKKTWSDCVKSDLNATNLASNVTLNRGAWRACIESTSPLLPTPTTGIYSPPATRSRGRVSAAVSK